MDYKIKIKHIKESCVLTKIPKDSQGFICSEISQNFNNCDKIFIAQNDAEIEILNRQLRFFNPTENILNFYAWDCSPYDRASPKPQILASRIKTLYNLSSRVADKNYFIVTSINALMQKTIALNDIKNLGLFLQVKAKNSLNQICEFLINKGYTRQSNANGVGEFAVRGGIIDVVMQQAGDLIGYRIDFFGDEIESIKIFDPISQISQESVKSFEILPISEVLLNQKTIENFRQKYRQKFGASIDDQFYQAISEGRTFDGVEHWLSMFYQENLISFFEYLKNPVIFFDEKIYNLSEEREALIQEYYKARLDEKSHKNSTIYNAVEPNSLYFSASEIAQQISQKTHIEFQTFDCNKTNNSDQRIIDLEFKNVPDFALASRTNKQDVVELLKNFLQNYSTKKVAIAVLSEGFKDRFARILQDYNLALNNLDNFLDFQKIKFGKIASFIFPTHFGFETSDFIIIGEQALFGEKIVRKKISKSASQRLIEESLSIHLGELIVHRDHGIGKFDGIHTISALGIKTDMIKIIYGGGDTLFVPVDNINLISRYGAENSLVQLDRLGVAGWRNRRDKVRKKIKVAAEELLKIAASRQLKKAPIFIPDTHFYDEFRARFGFVETEDQMRAIEEVEQDLQKGTPMDRLICGDVGFGKTEVALRASAIVCKFSQVAIVAPTTLLVRQHYKNFCKRFEGTGVKIVQLSRLVSTSEAKISREEIENGKADIIIGTHSLLQKNLKFHNLGLLIIDEEQHFGVAQKEQLKKFRTEVHVLTLSATPIPRTLQMSLAGVKDLSLIATPPVDRLSVRNFVMPYDSVIVREAVMREYNRSGKVFFVVPRVRDVEEMEPRLKIILPELKITHAHGQMNPSQLEEIMNDFIDGKIDVLLSTTIIESGIDISSANTMIIYKAEMFGLSQLYQLRGRVGRGKVRGYCYFMLDNKHKIADESRKKLEVMQNLDALGVGFSIASHDMDIRGSGNLLGDEQSGHVKETGVELYQQMLVETIEKIKNNVEFAVDGIEDFEKNTTIKLGISLLIPEDYMSDLSLRMSFYKKISYIKNIQDRENLINEMTDRFGKIPQEILNLFEVALLKNLCQKVGVENLEIAQDGFIVAFKNNKFAGAEKLMKMIFESKNKIRLANGQKLLFIMNFKTLEEKIYCANDILKKLQNLL